jgi:signal transduction protein with GAF and PtsI domain
MTREPPKPIVQVHHRGARGVDGILRLIELAGHDGPLEAMLTAMCDELAAIAGADIASVYVHEDDRLVMRGNHGFAPSAIGTTLDVGEGITGLVAECMRPVSAAHAAAEAAYKAVPGLGEERFPVFVGVPLIGAGSVIGVLVLQRRTRIFSQDEVTLATALGAPITLAIERRLATAMRSARLVGRGHVAGAVLGRVGLVPTTTALGAPPVELERAFGRLREDLGRAMKRLAEADAPAVGASLDRFALALCDARLREQLVAADQPDGLRKVAKEYARAPYRLGVVGSASLGVQVVDIEELCVLLADPRSMRPGHVWIADRIHAFVAIAAVARGAAALVASDACSLDAIAIARAAGLPVVSDVPGLFGWARPNDLLAVDGESGEVLVSPAPTEIERLRRAR